MKTLKSIFKIYGIRKALFKEENKLKLIIIERDQNITMNRWINFINLLKHTFSKDIDFILFEDAKKTSLNLNDFVLIGDDYDE